jgi:hypothetical protein
MEITNIEQLYDTMRDCGICTPGERWAGGLSHHPKSIALFNALSVIDMVTNKGEGDWTSGGDGDNGEQLMYLFDIIFELEGLGYTVSKDAWM